MHGRSLLPMLTILLGACAQEAPPLPPPPPASVDASRMIEVHYSHRDLDLAFPSASATLSAAEATRLDTLLRESGPGEGLRATISTAPGDPLAARRLAAVSRVLERQGVVASIAETAAPANHVRVMLGRYTAAAAPCSDDVFESIATDGLLRVRAQGCTTANNLAAMLADPGDLVAPRGHGAFDGVPAAAAVNRYRNDRTIPLMVTPDLPINSTPGAAPQGAPQSGSTGAAAGGGP